MVDLSDREATMYYDPTTGYQLSKYRQAEDHARSRQAVMVRTALLDTETRPGEPRRRLPRLRFRLGQVSSAPPKLNIGDTR